MNNRGIFFSIMATLMIITIIALMQTTRQERFESYNIFEAAQITETKDYYSNIEKDAVDLVKSGLRKTMAERILPFSYSIDSNSISINQELPVNQSTWNTFFDFLNTYKIFITDANYSNAFMGLVVDANTIRNGGTSGWNGNTEKTQFLVDPVCTGVTEDQNGKAMVIAETKNTRCSSYDFTKIKWIDVNIVTKFSVEDYNTIIWDRNDQGTSNPPEANCSSGGCPNQSYSQSGSTLYYRFFLNDSNCANCSFTPGTQKTIKENLPYTSKLNIKVSCTGAGCNSDPVYFSIDNGIRLTHSSDERVNVILSVYFDTNITKFSFLDFNYSVSGRDYNIFKTNNPTSFG